MRILDLHVENVGKIKVFDFKSDGKNVVIGGKNGQGKTSVLNAIEMLLAGKKSFPKKPVREGQETASITAELEGGFFVERQISSSGQTSLIIKNKEGAKYSTPQTLLDGFRGSNTLDPVHFLQLDDKGQIKLLRDLVGLDFSELDQKREELYKRRSEVNKKGQEFRSILDSIEEPTGDLPNEEINSKDLAEELSAALEVDRMNLRLATLEKEIEKMREEQEHIEAIKLKYGKIRDSQTVRDEISNLNKTNERIRNRKKHEDLLPALDALRVESKNLTNQIEKIDIEKENRLSKAKFPLPGLEFGEDGVLYNKIPLASASSAEKLRISTAIAFALQPKLKVVLVRDGSLLDADNLKAIQEIAEQYEGHVWIERVGDGKECSVVLEEGEIIK